MYTNYKTAGVKVEVRSWRALTYAVLKIFCGTLHLRCMRLGPLASTTDVIGMFQAYFFTNLCMH